MLQINWFNISNFILFAKKYNQFIQNTMRNQGDSKNGIVIKAHN